MTVHTRLRYFQALLLIPPHIRYILPSATKSATLLPDPFSDVRSLHCSSGAHPEHQAGLDWHTLDRTRTYLLHGWEQVHSEWNQEYRESWRDLGCWCLGNCFASGNLSIESWTKGSNPGFKTGKRGHSSHLHWQTADVPLLWFMYIGPYTKTEHHWRLKEKPSKRRKKYFIGGIIAFSKSGHNSLSRALERGIRLTDKAAREATQTFTLNTLVTLLPFVLPGILNVKLN